MSPGRDQRQGGQRRRARSRQGAEAGEDESGEAIPPTCKSLSDLSPGLVVQCGGVNVPVLWLSDLQPIKAIPLYGVATEEFWLQSASPSLEAIGGRVETRS